MEDQKDIKKPQHPNTHSQEGDHLRSRMGLMNHKEERGKGRKKDVL